MDPDRYNMRKLPVGMTFDAINDQLTLAVKLLDEGGHLTVRMHAALLYAAKQVCNVQMDEIHSKIAQRPKGGN